MRVFKAIVGLVLAGAVAAVWYYGAEKQSVSPNAEPVAPASVVSVAATKPKDAPVSARAEPEDINAKPEDASSPDVSNLPAPKDAPNGAWVFKESENAALFGPPNTEAIVSVRCEDGKLRITQNGQKEQTSGVRIGLSSGSIALKHVSSTAGMPTSAGEIDVNDPGVGKLVAEKASYVIRAGSLPPIRLPATEMIGRVVEACRAASGAPS